MYEEVPFRSLLPFHSSQNSFRLSVSYTKPECPVICSIDDELIIFVSVYSLEHCGKSKQVIGDIFEYVTTGL
jgi:hypothetical protein